jgi:tRNA (guanine37-N1)-methyltransferase
MPKPAIRIDILTLFPAMFQGPLTESLISRAQEQGILKIDVHDIRSFTEDKHHTADDRPFGGGAGMVMKPEPIYRALRHVGAARTRTTTGSRTKNAPYVIYLSPQGRPLNQAAVVQCAQHRHLVLLCGHYEGVDERAMAWVDEEISIGDYVVTGGELPAMVLIDAAARLLPGVVKEKASVEQDSFYAGLLDYPHYTRPAVFKGKAVPEVLRNGNHALVQAWRREQSLVRTRARRPDLLTTAALSSADKKILATHAQSRTAKKPPKGI